MRFNLTGLLKASCTFILLVLLIVGLGNLTDTMIDDTPPLQGIEIGFADQVEVELEAPISYDNANYIFADCLAEARISGAQHPVGILTFRPGDIANINRHITANDPRKHQLFFPESTAMVQKTRHPLFFPRQRRS